MITSSVNSVNVAHQKKMKLGLIWQRTFTSNPGGVFPVKKTRNCFEIGHFEKMTLF